MSIDSIAREIANVDRDINSIERSIHPIDANITRKQKEAHSVYSGSSDPLIPGRFDTRIPECLTP